LSRPRFEPSTFSVPFRASTLRIAGKIIGNTFHVIVKTFGVVYQGIAQVVEHMMDRLATRCVEMGSRAMVSATCAQ